jgi:hypothetical protein
MVATASREYLGMTKSACPTDPAMHRFPQPVLLQKRSKNGAVSGAEVPGLVPFSFPRIVTVFPFLHSWNPGTGRLTRGKSRVRKRKETPSKLGVSWKNTAF